MNDLEKRVVESVRSAKVPKKARYTFFIEKDVKLALKLWCKDRGLKESPALEEMIRLLVPSKYFKKE